MILTGNYPSHATLLKSKKIILAATLFALGTGAFQMTTRHLGRRSICCRRSVYASPSKRFSSHLPANVISLFGFDAHSSCGGGAEAYHPLPAGNNSDRVFDDRVSLSRFEVDGEGNIVGGADREAEVARTFRRDGFMLARCSCPRAVDSIRALAREAACLLDKTRTVEEKLENFGPIQSCDEDTLVGYAGGEEYGGNEFLESRGLERNSVMPPLGPQSTPSVVSGRRALATISTGVLRTIFRLSLPDTFASSLLELVDNGEDGGSEGTTDQERMGKGRLSCTSLRMCRYARADGVSFEAHTDKTIVTAVPCASTPGLEILQRSTNLWIRPEAAHDAKPGADVMILAGDLLEEALGKGKCRAAVHRVVRPAGLSESRVSTPLFLRGPSGSSVQRSLLPLVVDGCLTWGSGKRTNVETSTGVEQSPGIPTVKLQSLSRSSSPWSASEYSPFLLARPADETKVRETFEAFAHDGIHVISVDPLLVRLNGFASRDECEALIQKASPTMTESTTWTDGDSQHDSSPVRISSTTWLADSSLQLLEEWTARVCSMSGLPASFMEKWQVARYEPGGFFNVHTDHVEAFNDLQCGGRLATLILYLNDDFDGGNTEFPSLEVSVKPRAGDAIYFHSVQTPLARSDAEKMRVDERSAHAGLPVHTGSKWIATKWVHPLPYPYGTEGPPTVEEAQVE